ncbi:hypothetical protein C8R45DRAFT_1083703 [Mycena sanguinolenta]|nr:hypothetical protein C8R45DRAFT_1083703 [Mycena sanguinolenta]
MSVLSRALNLAVHGSQPTSGDIPNAGHLQFSSRNFPGLREIKWTSATSSRFDVFTRFLADISLILGDCKMAGREPIARSYALRQEVSDLWILEAINATRTVKCGSGPSAAEIHGRARQPLVFDLQEAEAGAVGKRDKSIKSDNATSNEALWAPSQPFYTHLHKGLILGTCRCECSREVEQRRLRASFGSRVFTRFSDSPPRFSPLHLADASAVSRKIVSFKGSLRPEGRPALVTAFIDLRLVGRRIQQRQPNSVRAPDELEPPVADSNCALSGVTGDGWRRHRRPRRPLSPSIHASAGVFPHACGRISRSEIRFFCSGAVGAEGEGRGYSSSSSGGACGQGESKCIRSRAGKEQRLAGDTISACSLRHVSQFQVNVRDTNRTGRDRHREGRVLNMRACLRVAASFHRQRQVAGVSISPSSQIHIYTSKRTQAAGDEAHGQAAGDEEAVPRRFQGLPAVFRASRAVELTKLEFGERDAIRPNRRNKSESCKSMYWVKNPTKHEMTLERDVVDSRVVSPMPRPVGGFLSRANGRSSNSGSSAPYSRVRACSSLAHHTTFSWILIAPSTHNRSFVYGAISDALSVGYIPARKYHNCGLRHAINEMGGARPERARICPKRVKEVLKEQTRSAMCTQWPLSPNVGCGDSLNSTE